MKITNVNHNRKETKGLWQAWNKSYCYDLNRQINSLYDYITWNYPIYVIFNSPTNTGDSQNTPISKKLTETDPPYEAIVDMNIASLGAEVTETVSLFFPSRLSFHQGFYNESEHGTGYLCLPIKYTFYDTESGTIGWILPASLQPEYIIATSTPKTTNETSTSETTNAILLDETTWYRRIERDTVNYHYYIAKPAIPSDYQFYLGYKFDSGYICLLNKQPNGLNNDYHDIKLDINSYLIAPFGNGGYYNMWFNGEHMQSQYVSNNFDSFANSLIINLAHGCRYFAPNQYNLLKTSVLDIPNYIENNTNLSDIYKNPWNGREDIVGRFVDKNGEPIVFDVQYDIYSSVENNQLIQHFVADANYQLPIKEHKLILY